MPDLEDVEKRIDHGHQECLDDFARKGYRGKIGLCERHGRLMVVDGSAWFKEARNMNWWLDGPKRIKIARQLIREERDMEAQSKHDRSNG